MGERALPKSLPAHSNVGKLIDEGLAATGYDQSRLAGACHVAPSYVTKLRHGEIQRPDPELLARLAHALGQEVARYKAARLADVIGHELHELGIDFDTNEAGEIRQHADQWANDLWEAETH